MKIEVPGKAHREGTAKRAGNPYNFNQLHCLGKENGVEGQAACALNLMSDGSCPWYNILGLRRNLKQNSLRAYSSTINRIHGDKFGQRKVKTVKMSDAKAYMAALHDGGLKFKTVDVAFTILRPAFEMAVDDAIRKNPFKFKLADIIPKDGAKRVALTKKQQIQYLAFVREHGRGNYSDDIEILLHTGLRVPELYGLKKADVDLENRRIYVNKQLCRTGERPYFITAPKTQSGFRTIPPVPICSKRALV